MEGLGTWEKTASCAADSAHKVKLLRRLLLVHCYASNLEGRGPVVFDPATIYPNIPQMCSLIQRSKTKTRWGRNIANAIIFHPKRQR